MTALSYLRMTPRTVLSLHFGRFNRKFSLCVAISILSYICDANAQSIQNSSPVESGTGGVSLPGLGTYNRQNSGESNLGEGKGIQIHPRITLRSIFTNNALLSSSDKKNDFINEISPGISITSNGTRIRGFFDYTLRSISYAKNTAGDNIQHALNTRLEAELVSDWFFLDLSGSISRQTISASGLQTIDTTRTNSNIADVATYRVSPYIRGRALGFADYQIRYAKSSSVNNSDSLASDVNVSEWLGLLKEDSIRGRFGWAVQSSTKNIKFREGRTDQSDQIRGIASVLVTPQLKTYVVVGRESNNYLSLQKQSYSNTGYGVNWNPTERSRVEAEQDHRFFGMGHRVVVSHRMRNAALKYSDIKDVFLGTSFSSVGGNGSLFDVLFDQFASIEPDPIRRAQLVNNFLRANGLDSTTPATSGFLPSAATLQRNQQLALSLSGIRNIITVLANRTNTRRLDSISQASDDFSYFSALNQSGYGIQYAHTLGLGTSLNLLFFSQKTSGNYLAQGSKLKTYSANFSNQIGIRTLVSTGVRRSSYDSDANPYTETAIFVQLTMRF